MHSLRAIATIPHFSITCAILLAATSSVAQHDRLDDRIADPSKITEMDPSPMAEEVILPMPPDHRMASGPAAVPIDGVRWQKARAAIERGLVFLRESQSERGAWMEGSEAAPTDLPAQVSPVSIAVTAMAVKAFVQAGVDPVEDPAIAKAIDLIIASQQVDGSFGGEALANYVASTAVSALAALDAHDHPSIADHLREGVRWLTVSQWDQGEGLSERQDWFGGSGYGNHGRPDMSNTQMMLEALYDGGLSPDEPAFQNAVQFISRAQNYKPTNNAAWAGADGGFIYTPANDGESMASEYAGEGRFGEKIPQGQPRSLRSYGSMTYAGFKSLLYAGFGPNDPRVRAAFDWIRRHFTFDENPGAGQQGLYYYYHAMARALRVAQQDTITDENGIAHDWRAEMIDAILERQQDDGSWINDADRWMEGQPALVTTYAVLALEEALK